MIYNDDDNKRLQMAFTHARAHMGASFLSKRRPGPEETNFVSQIIGQFNKSALLPLCQLCMHFYFFTLQFC